MRGAGTRRKPLLEYEEPDYMLRSKSKSLAQMIRDSRRTIIYTGAGISTAAEIPDYRGPNGVYTLATQGREIKGCSDLTAAEPTLTHMILKELYRIGKVQHILSQNCDGLHLRSGLPQTALSEIHGNMYVEVCTNCDPETQHIRTFDVTANSAFKRHNTGRFCPHCSTELIDTIVHFGELGKLQWPLNWLGTTKKVEKADLIICIGTSLNVLKSYRFLWPDQNSHTNLVIINLQPTPKDNVAVLKIHGKSDDVMKRVADFLKIETAKYCRDCDPVLHPGLRIEEDGIITGISECTCHLRPPISINDVKEEPLNTEEEPECSSNSRNQPGWWAAGIERIKRKSGRGSTPVVVDDGRRKSARIAASAPPPKKAGRPRKRPFAETDFERDIRETLLSMLDKISPIVKKGRGRPVRGQYATPFEKEGSFKFAFGEPETSIEKKSKTEEQRVDFDSENDAEEMLSSSSDEESFDPSFRVPKHQMLTLAIRPGNISPRRRCSIEKRRAAKEVKLEIEESAKEIEEPMPSTSNSIIASMRRNNKSKSNGTHSSLSMKDVKEEMDEDRLSSPTNTANAIDLISKSEHQSEISLELEDENAEEYLRPPMSYNVIDLIAEPEYRSNHSVKAEEVQKSPTTFNAVDLISNPAYQSNLPVKSEELNSIEETVDQVASSNNLEIPSTSRVASSRDINSAHSSASFHPEMEKLTQIGYPRKRTRPYYEKPDMDAIQVNENTSLGLLLKMGVGNYCNEGHQVSAKTSEPIDPSEDAVAKYVRESRRNQQNTQLKKYLEKSLQPFTQLTGTLQDDRPVSTPAQPRVETPEVTVDTLMARTDEYFPSTKRQTPLADVLMRNIEEIKKDLSSDAVDEALLDLINPGEPDYHIKLPRHLMAKLEMMVIEEGGSQKAISGFLLENVADPSLMNVTIKDLMNIAVKFKRSLASIANKGCHLSQMVDKIKKECNQEST